MIICPVCQFRNPDANAMCFRCSALLTRDQSLVDEAFKRADQKFKLNRRRRIADSVDELSQHPVWLRLNALPDEDKYYFPLTAGLLSMILPGLGHVYAGQHLKGGLLAALSLILLVTAWIFLRESWSNWYLLGLLFYYMFVWAGSVATAIRANGGALVFRHIMALFFGAMMLLGSFLTVGQYLGLGFFSIEKITASGMMPALIPGERVVYSSVPLWFRDARRNEIVSFDPPRFTAERKADLISINVKRYYQRVLGLPGDTIKKSGDNIWRNGVLLRADELPFGADVMDDFELTVPSGHIYAPLTYLPEADFFSSLGGAPDVRYVGQEGYIFKGWDGYPFISKDLVRAKGLAVIHPPARRQWLP